MRISVFLALALVLPPFVAAQAQEDVSPAQKYRDCTRLSATQPGAALEQASAWRDQGGGVAAEHCIALALIGLERYADGANMLKRVTERIRAGRGVSDVGMHIGKALLAELYDQEGNAWLLADKPLEAYQALSAALTTVPMTDPKAVEYLIDRARSLAASRDYQAALKDLDQAQIMAADRPDIYLFRATARRHVKDLDGAMTDIDMAISLSHGDPKAYLERGNIHIAKGETEAARQDWLEAATRAPDSPTAQAAQSNIEELDLLKETVEKESAATKKAAKKPAPKTKPKG